MRPKRISLAAIDTYVVPVSQYDKGYRIQVGGTFVGTYSVEFTSADIHKLGAAAAIWKSETEQTAKTGGTGLHYKGGITAFRLNVTAYTSGSVEMNVTSGSRRISRLGPELITDAGDRDFSGGRGNWTVEAGGVVTWDNVDMDFNCGEWTVVQLAVTLADSTLHRIEFGISAYTSGSLHFYFGGNTLTPVIGEAVDTFVFYVTSGALNSFRYATDDFIGSIDNVSIKAVL